MKEESIYDRLSRLIAGNFNGEFPRWTKRGVCRKWVAALIGCRPATLSSSPKLKKMLVAWESLRKATSQPAADAPEPANDNVTLMRRGDREARIIWAQVKLNRQIWSVPTIVAHSAEQYYNDWFRFLVFKKKREPTSVDESAKHIRQFLKFCRKYKIALREVDDDVLLAWREELRERRTTTPRRNTLLRTVHAFFKWTAVENIYKHIAQVGRPSNYAESMADYTFPISSEEVMVITSRGNKRFHWVWPFLETGPGARYGRRHTPTLEEIDRIYAFTDIEKHGIRNVTIMNWALRTGARVSEILGLKCDDLPREDQYAELIEKDQWTIKLKKRKWHKEGGVLYVPADVIWDTINYIEGQRAEILANSQSKNEGAIFLSERGTPLVPDSVSRICNKLFNAADVDRANIHRLRARFAHNAVETALNHLEQAGVTLDPSSGWHQTALVIAAEMMGHTSTRSLEPYLHDIMFRRTEIARLRTQGGVIEPVEDRTAEKENIIVLGEKIADLMRAGNETEARKMARFIANSIDRRLLWKEPMGMAA
ncbi:tyrosine-type recombinase/integrase [Neorhizobium sp. IRS_2294]|uniref:tyrosine-type recombinase/integrase n=1 Tax=unclassified Neorhizobium TaxID=2629175 RepID=UPI003D2BAD8A